MASVLLSSFSLYLVWEDLLDLHFTVSSNGRVHVLTLDPGTSFHVSLLHELASGFEVFCAFILSPLACVVQLILLHIHP